MVSVALGNKVVGLSKCHRQKQPMPGLTAKMKPADRGLRILEYLDEKELRRTKSDKRLIFPEHSPTGCAFFEKEYAHDRTKRS